MSIEAPMRPIQKHQEPPSFEEIDIETADPKKLYRRLAYIIRPDLGKNHDSSVKLNGAYEKAQAGKGEDLVSMYNEFFSNATIPPELDAFEKEELKRKEIFDIIQAELEALYRVALKKRTPAILKNNQLRQRYEWLCKENGLRVRSEFGFMNYDSDFINKYLFEKIRSMIYEIKKRLKNKS